jgi:hypothetical protein
MGAGLKCLGLSKRSIPQVLSIIEAAGWPIWLIVITKRLAHIIKVPRAP